MQNQKLKAFLAASVALSFPVCMSNASGYERGVTARYMPAAHAQTPLLRGHNTVVSKLRGMHARPRYSAAFTAPNMRYVPVVVSGQRVNYPQARPTALPVSRYAPAAPIAARPALGKIMNHHLDAVENTPPTHQRPVPLQALSHHLDTTEAAPRIQAPSIQAPRVQVASIQAPSVQAYQQSHRVLTAAKPLTLHSAARSVSVPSAISAQQVPSLQVPSLRLSGLHHLDDARPVVLPRPVVTKQVLTQTPTAQPSVAQPSAPQTYTSQKSVAVVSTPAPSTPKTEVNSIDQSVSKARTQSTRLAIENLRIQEAEEGLIQAESQSRLRLNFDSAVGLGQFETDFNVVDRTESDTRLQRTARLNLSLPLYQGGRIKAQKDIAKVGIKSAHANFGAVASNVTQEAAIAHLTVIQNRELIKVYTHNVELLENQRTTVQSLVRAGENTVTDEALIDARLASIKVSLEQAHARLASSESNYKKLVGRPAPVLMQSKGVSLPGTLAEVKALAQKNNSLVKVAEADAETAFHNIEVAKSFGRPSLSLQGVLRAAEDQSETIRRNSAAEVLLNLTVPLLSGGENKSRVRQASLAQSRAVLETHRLHNDLNERVEQLWAELTSAQRSKAPNLAQKVAAQKAYEAVIKQRNAGLATSLDVLSIEQTLIDAQINLIQAQNVEDVSRFQLLGLMGVL